MAAEETEWSESWKALVMVCVFQLHPTYGKAVIERLIHKDYTHPTQRLLAERSDRALAQWMEVWHQAWTQFPLAWQVMKPLLAAALDVVIDPLPAFQQGHLSLYRCTVIFADVARPPQSVTAGLFSCFTWKVLAYWASLPYRVHAEIHTRMPVPLSQIDPQAEQIVQKMLPDLLLVAQTLPRWSRWLP